MSNKSQALRDHLILSLKWSGKHNDKYATWYRENSQGYVWSINHAGLYTKDDVGRYKDQTFGVPLWVAKRFTTESSFENVPAQYLPVERIPELLEFLDKLESGKGDDE